MTAEAIGSKPTETFRYAVRRFSRLDVPDRLDALELMDPTSAAILVGVVNPVDILARDREAIAAGDAE